MAAAASPSPSPSPQKHRRVSLALPATPRLVSPWHFRDDTSLASHVAETSAVMPQRKGKVRKIAADREPDTLVVQQKKQRKKWSEAETQMLVAGCNIWGVGNWKAILKDPSLHFDDRSPVDLKDRFRTYFPDAYKEHYPNAKTHLSSKVRSTLPDGRSIFEKTRSKKRRPFTEDEDRALRAGYEKHGTVWAAIVKDPIFQDQNRRSTDLRDRFRNAFPDLYQAAGYKPRNSSKKRKQAVVPATLRAATDDQLASPGCSLVGPTRKKRQGLLRGGTKSVPESTTCSEEEESSAGEDDSSQPKLPTSASSEHPFAEVGMDAIDALSEPLSIPDFMPSATQSLSELTDSSQSQTTWSGLETPIHPSSWSTHTGSPTSPHLSPDYLDHSPFIRRMSTIGKSAWGAQDWFSANPRLDTSAFSSSASSFADGLSPASSSPFSLHHLTHGVMDRYDLFPATATHDFASEVGIGDTNSTFSDPDMFPASGFRGFTHHSSYAGDLIFGARTHQPHQTYYGPGFGFGTPGLGLSGMQPPSGMHSIQLHSTALPGIDEIELASITLDDQPGPPPPPASTSEIGIQKSEKETPMSISSTLELFGIPSQSGTASTSMDDMVDLVHSTPPATPLDVARPMRLYPHHHHHHNHHHSHGNRSISVPPSEARPDDRHSSVVPLPPPPTVIPTGGSGRSLSFFDSHGGGGNGNGPTISPTATTIPDAWSRLAIPPSDVHGLSFLDLHYYSGGHSLDSLGAGMGAGMGVGCLDEPGLGPGIMDSNPSRQGQALDLADSKARPSTTLRVVTTTTAAGGTGTVGSSSPSSSSSSPSSYATVSQAALHGHGHGHGHGNGNGAQNVNVNVNVSACTAGSGTGVRTRHHHQQPPGLHHRGLSFVSPQDLQLRKANDNKRKRASWDGGIS